MVAKKGKSWADCLVARWDDLMADSKECLKADSMVLLMVVLMDLQ